MPFVLAAAGKNDYDFSSYISSTTTEEGSILLLGDSWAALSGDAAANICGLHTTRLMTNDAKSGTTASEWADKGTAVESLTNAKYDYQYVWLSLGGNDFLNNKCDIDMAEEVAADIITVIGHIVDNSANENIKILYMGYTVPSQDVCGNGKTAELFEEQGAIIFNAIKSSDYASHVTLIDISETFVSAWSYGSEKLSDPYYYYDEIHLNMYGYLYLFSTYKVQKFFGCSAAETLEVKALSGAMEAKDGHYMSLAGIIISTIVVAMMAMVGLGLLVKFVKEMSAAKRVEATTEKAETGDYVVVKEKTTADDKKWSSYYSTSVMA